MEEEEKVVPRLDQPKVDIFFGLRLCSAELRVEFDHFGIGVDVLRLPAEEGETGQFAAPRKGHVGLAVLKDLKRGKKRGVVTNCPKVISACPENALLVTV